MFKKYSLLFLFILSGALCVNAQDNPSVITYSGNMISKGDFMSRDPQQRPLRWIMGTGLQTATISSEQKHSSRIDDKSLKIADSSALTEVLVRSGKRIVNPGTAYITEARVKGTGGKPAILNLEFGTRMIAGWV